MVKERNKANITYLLGAGASRYACPILKEQGEKMVQMARQLLPSDRHNFSTERPVFTDEKQNILWDIGYFGSKALKYGTIDTYAKKLNLNNSLEELSRLKMAVSIFFTLWQLTDDRDIKSINNFDELTFYEEIDRRYITLLAAIIEKKSDVNIAIKDNINFVTWNYDLQLEFAFKAFCYDNMSWDYLSNNLKFRINDNNNSRLQICHLNGYHGFYNSEGTEYNFIDVTKSTELEQILGSIDFISASRRRNQIDFMNHINYAWERNEFSNKARVQARSIFLETDILIIIGYSFPNFNKEIDIDLFKQLGNRRIKIYYQDPNASESFLAQLVDLNDVDLICQREKLDTFTLPYVF
jgi:hypothetical protein